MVRFPRDKYGGFRQSQDGKRLLRTASPTSLSADPEGAVQGGHRNRQFVAEISFTASAAAFRITPGSLGSSARCCSASSAGLAAAPQRPSAAAADVRTSLFSSRATRVWM